MLLRSQPLDPDFCRKMGWDEHSEIDEVTEDNIKSQYIGKMFVDDMLDDEESKITLKTRLGWKWREIKGMFYDVKYALGNYIKWRKTISGLRPWEGFDGLISVMLCHLHHYVEMEKRNGHSEAEFKKAKIVSAQETIELLERLKDPLEYAGKRRKEVDAKYPDYKCLITHYKSGGTSCSGRFVAYGAGWVGQESGNNPREGYFEFRNGQFVLADSPDRDATDRLLAELLRYDEEVHAAYRQAEDDSENDFDRLNQLLKENLYSWWD